MRHPGRIVVIGAVVAVAVAAAAAVA